MHQIDNLKNTVLNLEKWVSIRDYMGYDPYDGLRSKIFNFIPLYGKYSRIAWTQFFKVCPVNLRHIFLIPKGKNPKGMGLFLSSYVNLYKATGNRDWIYKAQLIGDWLEKNRSKNITEYCWGYNFDWQSRAFFLPEGTPTIVNTSFIGHAFLDLFEITNNNRWLEIVGSSCQFILNNLNRYETKKHLCFSYTPIDQTKIHNASILGVSLLARYSKIKNDSQHINLINKATNYLVDHQLDNGAWYYAETDYQKWVDSFHTGFNLYALRHINDFINSSSLSKVIELGDRFYMNNFFLYDGTPKYYHDKLYPWDIHSSAMALAYFSSQKNNDNRLTESIFTWMSENMKDDSGYFYFRKTKIIKNKIPYMRWGQSWAMYGLSKYYLCKQ